MVDAELRCCISSVTGRHASNLSLGHFAHFVSHVTVSGAHRMHSHGAAHSQPDSMTVANAAKATSPGNNAEGPSTAPSRSDSNSQHSSGSDVTCVQMDVSDLPDLIPINGEQASGAMEAIASQTTHATHSQSVASMTHHTTLAPAAHSPLLSAAAASPSQHGMNGNAVSVPLSSLSSLSSPLVRRTASYSSLMHPPLMMAPLPGDRHSSISTLESLASPLQPRRSVSLVPRHDYIPSHSTTLRRMPSGSPIPPSANAVAASPQHKPLNSAAAAAAGFALTDASGINGPRVLDASSVASSVLRSSHALIPISTPASFVPPSPTPMTSPFRSILRVHSTPLPGAAAAAAVAQANAQATAAAAAASDLAATEPTPIAIRLFQDESRTAESNGGASAAPSSAASSSTAANAAAPAPDAAAPFVPGHSRRSSLRPNAARACVAATEAHLAELQHAHDHPQDERKNHSPSAAVSAAVSSDSNHSLSLHPSKRARTDSASTQQGEQKSSSSSAAAAVAAPAVAESDDNVGTGVLVGSSLSTPPAKHSRRRSSGSLSVSASPGHSRRGSFAASPASSKGAHPRVRFDRAVIYEFGSIPDASKVPGDGDYSIGLSRRPHAGFVASLDTFERLRQPQRKLDGPDAIDEELRKAVWVEAQHEAERLSAEQRSRSGIKLATHSLRKRKRHSEQEEQELSESEYESESDIEDEESSAEPSSQQQPSQAHAGEQQGEHRVHYALRHTPSEDTGMKDASSSSAAAAGSADSASDPASASFVVPSLQLDVSPASSAPHSPRLHGSHHGPGVSQPPSPSSACFRLVPAGEDSSPDLLSPDSEANGASAASLRVPSHSSHSPHHPVTHHRPATPYALHSGSPSPHSPSASPDASGQLSNNPSASPPPALLFSDSADLASIRASRRTAGCDCRGTRQIKVCGAPQAHDAQNKKGSKGSAAPLGSRAATNRMLAEAIAASMASASSAAAAAASMPDAADGTHSRSSSDASTSSAADSSSLSVCPCAAAGVGCNSNICRCFSYCCVNPQGRYIFNQTKVNTQRRKILSAIQP